jgi:hypothetical protein
MKRLAAILVALLFTLSAFGDTPVTPGAPRAIDGQPAMYFGVKSCGKTVMWVLLTNGHFFRVDEQHSPPDMKAFMKQLAGVKGDIVEISCASAI